MEVRTLLNPQQKKRFDAIMDLSSFNDLVKVSLIKDLFQKESAFIHEFLDQYIINYPEFLKEYQIIKEYVEEYVWSRNERACIDLIKLTQIEGTFPISTLPIYASPEKLQYLYVPS